MGSNHDAKLYDAITTGNVDFPVRTCYNVEYDQDTHQSQILIMNSLKPIFKNRSRFRHQTNTVK
jgi:hypothetical protein